MKEAKALMALSNVKILPIDNLDEAASMVSLVDCTCQFVQCASRSSVRAALLSLSISTLVFYTNIIH